MGATFNGDGTTSAEATSNGGVGAWNHGTATTSGGGAWTAIPNFEGATPAYGTLPAGTTVFVRTKDAAGSDITVTKTTATTLGAGAGVGTELAPITWVFDAGVVWSGVSGVVTYNMTSTAAWTVQAYNNLMATNYNLTIKNSNTEIGHRTWCTLNACSTQSVKFDCSATMTSTGPHISEAGGVHTDLWLTHGSVTYAIFDHSSTGVDTVFINLKIEVLGTLYFAASATSIFGSQGHTGGTTVLGGIISGGALSGVSLLMATSPNGSFSSYGFSYPSTMIVSNATLYTSKLKAVFNGADGVLGNVVYDYWCEYSSRFDGFYPTLNALLETSSGATKWVYRLHTYRTTPQNPAQIALSKMWTQAASVKTVTVEILWPTSMNSGAGNAPDVGNVWITVSFTDDSTGAQVIQTTRAFTGANLAASTNPGWSATTYGASSFSRYKLEVTTTSSIKQDTPVLVSLFVIPRAVSAAPLDIIMVCPDPVLSTP